MRTVWESFLKELRLWRRDPKIFLGSQLAPLAVLITFYLLFGNLQPIDLAVTNLDQGSQGQKFVELLRNEPSPLGGAYFNPILVSEEEAQKMFTEGSILATLTIPPAFSQDLAAGKDTNLELQIDNYNSDFAKNVRLYLREVIGHFYRDQVPGMDYTITEEFTWRDDVAWFEVIAVGLIGFSVMLGGMFNGLTLLVRELEEQTIKELLLAPRSLAAILSGKILFALAGALLSGFIMYVVARLITGPALNIPGIRMFPAALLTMSLLALVYIGIGLILASVFKRYMPAAFAAILTGFTSWLYGGALTPASLYEGLNATISSLLPSTYATEIMRSLIIWQSTDGIGHNLAMLALLACALILLALSITTRSLKRAVA